MKPKTPVRGAAVIPAAARSRRLLVYLVLGAAGLLAVGWILSRLPEREVGDQINYKSIVAFCLVKRRLRRPPGS